MSKLERLIEELCPDGVEYKTIDNISTRLKGMSGVSKKWYESGNCQFIEYKNVYKNLKINIYQLPYATVKKIDSQTILNQGDILFTSASETPNECAISSVIEDIIKEGVFLDDHLFGIRLRDKNVNPVYLNYYCHTNEFRKKVSKVVRGVTRFYVSLPDFMKIKVPVPPLPIQEEIVRILDSFTELKAQLEEELEARKKQYEWYRDQLFSIAKDKQTYYINQISENCDNQRKPVTSGNRTCGEYPYYGSSGIVDYVDNYIFDGDYLLISEDGANLLARNTPIAFSISGKNWVNNHAHVLQFETYETRRYIEIYLNSIDLSPYITGGAQPKLNQKNLNRIPIPLPSLEEQQRIVAILDRFDKLCNDISEGLPAEIDARQKQYEYYRDKLLTFKRLEDREGIEDERV